MVMASKVETTDAAGADIALWPLDALGGDR
jgi:hypothetical protein